MPIIAWWLVEQSSFRAHNHLLDMPSTLSTSVEISLYNTNVYTLIFEVAIVATEQNAALKPASVFTKWRLGA